MRRGHHRGPGAGGRVIEGLHSPTLIQGQAGSGQSPLPAGQMRGTARPPAGPPHTPFLMSLGGVGVGGVLVFAEAFISSGQGLRHLFIFSAIMQELPEKRLKVWAFLDAGITAKEQARAAGTAVTRR